ncbi:MAG: aminotransferase class I/II-fold pyridoxal phosphate-dependent enzyme [Gammaproteobacteria bacterium]|nr:aminotransferase class I/II-fold pyridoxal phosphate-dependent enzyme [Rhizobiaceae bacterium]NKC13749.1 aminotransferase class I/II-fold pyridoxal phosphate-dependent enzyme [Gammaproteobacteria bacterium]
MKYSEARLITGEDVQHYSFLQRKDPEIFSIFNQENKRQNATIELIASANAVSPGVLEAMGSALTDNVVEGYIGERYFSGCQEIDRLESLAMERAKRLFGAAHANVQPYSCSQANQAVYLTTMEAGERLLSMDLMHGGHLTHGAKFTMTAHHYEVHSYQVSRENEQIDYDRILRQAKEIRPKLIIAGASAYPRIIDFRRFRKIADEVGAYLLADMAHVAGLVAAGLYPSPVPHAHVVTSSTQKTLRGPRGGIILLGEQAADQLSRKIDSALFPGMQGAAHMHIIAAKAVALQEASQPEFAEYQRVVLNNARVLAADLEACGFRIVSGGTDTHLMLVDLRSRDITGREAESRLENIGITVNRNLIPYDVRKPWIASGIRIGTSAITSRGFGPEEMHTIATIIDKVLKGKPGAQILNQARQEVTRLCHQHTKNNSFTVAVPW